jgi:hypothetical protein
MPGQPINVFVSYSRDDESLVAPVVRLLRVNTSYVFQDIDGIRPGKKWREEIARGIAESNLVVVFWCNHACQSAAVGAEWRAAIEQKKDLLPLLMDATPLPGELRDFQYIDFRGTVGESHSSYPSNTPAHPMPSASTRAPSSTRSMPSGAPKYPARWLSLGAIAAVLVVAVSISLLSLDSQDSNIGEAGKAMPPDYPQVEASPPRIEPSQKQPPSIAVKPAQPPQKAQPPLPVPLPTPESPSLLLPEFIGLLLIGVALAAGAGWYYWGRRRRLKEDVGSRRASIPPDLVLRPSSRWESTGTGFEFERQMASQIEAEIARRTGN